jgi:hypothetical protein
MKSCDTCKHESKSAVDNPCRNCLPSPRLPSWQPATVEQTPAARIAALREVCQGLLNCMNMQIGRENGSLHITNTVARGIWDEWITKAITILEEPK